MIDMQCEPDRAVSSLGEDQVNSNKIFLESCQHTLRRCVKSSRDIYAEEILKLIKDEKIRHALQDVFEKRALFQTEQCMKAIQWYMEQEQLTMKLSQLDAIVRAHQVSSTDSIAWRPTGIPALDVEAHLSENYSVASLQYESLSGSLKKQNCEIEADVVKLTQRFKELKTQILSCSSNTRIK